MWRGYRIRSLVLNREWSEHWPCKSEVSGSQSVELGFCIPIVSGILDSLTCITDSKAQDSGFKA